MICNLGVVGSNPTRGSKKTGKELLAGLFFLYVLSVIHLISSDTPHYENVPFEVPSSWEWTTVENICSKIGSGSTPKGSNYAPDGILFFRSQNVYNDGVVIEDIKYISEEVHQSMIGTEVLPNDLLLNITGGSLGRCAIIPNDIDRGNVSQHVCILRPVIVKAEYLHIFILSSFFAKTMKITGSGREGLPKYNLEKMLLPLPPLEEQTRIIHELNKWIDWVITIEDNQQDLVENIKQAKSKILDLAIHGKLVPQDPSEEPASELLKRINPKAEITCDNGQYGKISKGWCLCRLGDIGKIVTGNTPTKDIAEYYGGNIPFYKPADLEEGICIKNASDHLSVLGFEQARKIPANSILVTCIGATIGKTGLITVEGSCNQQINAIIPNEVAYAEFIYYTCISDYMQKEIKSNASATTLPILNKGNFAKLPFPLPPYNEQQRIVNKIEELFTSLDNIQKALEA